MRLKDLRLVLSAAPKKYDVRYYLNGVNVTKDAIVGSDGHRLCHITTSLNNIPNDHANIIVPAETIKALLKKIGTKHDDSEASIFLINNRYEISCMGQLEVFTPINHKYITFKKIIDPIKLNNHSKNLNAIRHQFNWGNVALANNALCVYFGNTTSKALCSDEQLGYFMPSDDIIYVIMPCRV